MLFKFYHQEYEPVMAATWVYMASVGTVMSHPHGDTDTVLTGLLFDTMFEV